MDQKTFIAELFASAQHRRVKSGIIPALSSAEVVPRHVARSNLPSHFIFCFARPATTRYRAGQDPVEDLISDLVRKGEKVGLRWWMRLYKK